MHRDTFVKKLRDCCKITVTVRSIRIFAKIKQKIVAIALPDNSCKWSAIFASSLSSFCNGVPGSAVHVASIYHRGRTRVSVTAFVVVTFGRAVRCLGLGRTRLLIKVSASSPVNEVGLSQIEEPRASEQDLVCLTCGGSRIHGKTWVKYYIVEKPQFRGQRSLHQDNF